MAESLKPPDHPFDPFTPSAEQPWDVPAVGHLLRRAGFGVSMGRLEAMLKLAPREAIASLTDYDPANDPFNEMLIGLRGLATPFTRNDNNGTVTSTAQNWWIYRMLYTPHPLQEKIALFWHNRFATSELKLDNPSMIHRQIELFRQMGLGSFRDLLVAVGRDPAMLVWLDGQTNHKGHPNENYAREIMELFVLGVGNYTERDIQELARAFTGWRVASGGERAQRDPKLFDDGIKEAFGRRGKFDDQAAVDLILEQPAAPRFIAMQLLREFVHPHPLNEHIEHYAKRLREHEWKIRPVLEEIFASRLFFSPWAYRSKIKSPIELVVGGALALEGKVNTSFLRDAALKMGQSLLYPPSVKGWDGEEAWINANSMLLRFNFGLALATQRRSEFARPSDIEGWLLKHRLKSADDIIDHYCRLLLDGRVRTDDRKELRDFMNQTAGPANKRKPFALEAAAANVKVRDLLHLIMSTPEYQLA